MKLAATITKSYAGREVLSAATLEVAQGTVHALVGENGAGKSTLVKVIAGIVDADRGELEIAGVRVELAGWNRSKARQLKIGIVQQHGASAGTLSVVENAVLGRALRPESGERPGGVLVELDGTANKLRELGAHIGLEVDPEARHDRLALGAQQRAEIVAALHAGADLLILDEPTAVLTPVEVEGLLHTLRGLAGEGPPENRKTIIIVTHKLDEVRTVADAVTVLRAGKTVATFSRSDGELDTAAIARAMVGAEMAIASAGGVPSTLAAPGEQAAEMLSLSGVAVGRELSNITLAVRAGELVGVAGIDGNGQRELALAIAGLAKHAGTVAIGGSDVSRASPGKRLAAGLAHIPEDRHHGGLMLDASIADNLTLGRRDVTGRFVIDRAAVATFAAERIAELDVRPPDPTALARSLSGGNQQKVVIARELSRPNLRAVVAAQPTRGVDLGAVARIHDRLREAARGGAGVLVISADLDELLALCHRIVVLLRGAIVGEVGGAELADKSAREKLGALMTGASSRAGDPYRQAAGRASP